LVVPDLTDGGGGSGGLGEFTMTSALAVLEAAVAAAPADKKQVRIIGSSLGVGPDRHCSTRHPTCFEPL